MYSSRERSLRPPYQRRLRLRGARSWFVKIQSLCADFLNPLTEHERFEGDETFVKPAALWRAHRSPAFSHLL